MDRAHPAYVRRLRLSTGGIFAALILTCAAYLAVIAAVERSEIVFGPEASVLVEGPVNDDHGGAGDHLDSKGGAKTLQR